MDQIIQEPEWKSVSSQRRQFQWLVSIRALIRGQQLHEYTAMVVTPCGRLLMHARPGNEGADPLQSLCQCRIEAIVQGNGDRMERGDIDVLRNGIGHGDFNTKETWIAAKGMGTDENTAKAEDSGLRQREQHLARLGIHSRQSALATHAGKATTLPLALPQILVHPPGTLDALPNLLGVWSEIALNSVIGEPLNRVPVFAPAPLTKHGRATEFQDRILLKARDQVRVSRLDRQGKPSEMPIVSHTQLPNKNTFR